MSGQTALFTPEAEIGLRKSLFADAVSWANGFSGGNDFDEVVWDTPSRLSVSFAPDGTHISKYQSSLFTSFEYLLDDESLQRTILDALQTWAREANVNFGLVSDSGDPFGTGGPTQGDTRFGDVRIGAVPLSEEVYAFAVRHNEFMSGTWAGDIIFNANATFESTEQFLAVTMHEIGHVLGLDHSTDPKSVMNPAALNYELSTSDFKQLRNKYGFRLLDQYDLGNDRNDTFDDATKIRHSGSMGGKVPLFVYGDIEGSQDVDYFFLDPLSNYHDSVTFRLVSDGISFLRPQLEIFDETGNLLGSAVGAGNYGSDVSVTLANVDDETTYFARITGTGGDATNIGSYSMLTTFDKNVSAKPAIVESTLRADYGFLDQDDVHEIFTEENPAFNDDLHTNDTFLTADELESIPGAIDLDHYRIQASLSDAIDVDYYFFESASFGRNGLGVLTAKLNAMDLGGLISDVEIFDSNFNQLNSRIIVNGNGQYVIQVDGIESEAIYYAKVVADTPGIGFDTGNYTLDVSFGTQSVSFDQFAKGLLSAAKSERFHTLYVAETQLFHLALTSSDNPAVGNATVWMTVYNEEGNVVYRAATRPGETRTAKSVVLQPGSYSIQVNLALEQPSGSQGNEGFLRYQISGQGTSDPVGPELVNPATMPFPKCDPNTDDYCYPNDRRTPDPYIVVNGNEFSPPPGTTHTPGWYDINAWYWFNNWLTDEVPS